MAKSKDTSIRVSKVLAKDLKKLKSKPRESYEKLLRKLMGDVK